MLPPPPFLVLEKPWALVSKSAGTAMLYSGPHVAVPLEIPESRGKDNERERERERDRDRERESISNIWLTKMTKFKPDQLSKRRCGVQNPGLFFSRSG